MSARTRREPKRTWTRGFTILELTIVLLLSAMFLGYSVVTFGGYFQEVAAQRAAHVFARDLLMARSTALRSRERVVIRFSESSRSYLMVAEPTGTEIVRRRFGPTGDIRLSAIDLRMAGDTITFSRRGVANMQNAFGPVGEARFAAGSATYRVHFNAMGASKVEGS